MRERFVWIVGVGGLIAVIAVHLLSQRQHSRSVRPGVALLTTGRTTIAQLSAPEKWATLARAEPRWDVAVKATDDSIEVIRRLDRGEGNVG